MVTEIVSAIRSTRARYGISPKSALKVSIKAEAGDVALLQVQGKLLQDMANISDLAIAVDAQKPDESSVVLAAGLEIYIALSGLVDFEAERKRLEKERKSLESDVAKFEKKLSNPGFLAKAAPEIIEKDQQKCADLKDRLERVKAQLAEIS